MTHWSHYLSIKSFFFPPSFTFLSPAISWFICTIILKTNTNTNVPSSHPTPASAVNLCNTSLEMLSLPSPPPFPSTKDKNGDHSQPVPQWKKAMNRLTRAKEKVVEEPVFRQPRRTKPLVWCVAVLCLIFSLLLIFFGVATLIVVLTIRPRKPVFDTPNASLNLIYFNSPDNFNGDFIFLANFSNPNKKFDVRFEYVNLELYFSDSLISAQGLQPFSMRRGETRLVSLRMISSLVFLPQNSALKLQRQVQTNRITYNIRGTFKVKANLGLIHFSYWLHSRCRLEMTSPPTGVLVARNCRTKR